MNVLMVCTGNICRSPAAEVVLRRYLDEAEVTGIAIDSAGTGDWHAGERAHELTRKVGLQRGYHVTHRARMVNRKDFEECDLFLAMDKSHYRWLADRIHPGTEIRYLRSFDPKSGDTTPLDDPYGKSDYAFESMYDDIEAAMPGLVEYLRTQHCWKSTLDSSNAACDADVMTMPPFFNTCGIGPAQANRVRIVGDGALPSVFDVTRFATSAVASVALAASDVAGLCHPTRAAQDRQVTVDQRLTSLWMGTSVQAIGWSPPSAWDDLAGDYLTADNTWIRLHTNAKTHRAAALRVLGCEPTKEAVANEVRARTSSELESDVHDAGGVAGAMRSADEWASHPQGVAVAAEPLVHLELFDALPRPNATRTQAASESRPLGGLRVLDLTKVLAGPVATRTLAMLGADVIRVDDPAWAEPGVSHDTTLGKQCVHINGRSVEGQVLLRQLFAEADMFVHGYRPGALDAIGLSAAQRREMNPGIVEVSLNAYGHTGPWSGRRGFDSVVQMSCGIAHAGMTVMNRDRPTPLPVQALDHVTGYLMAAAALRGWKEKLESGRGSSHRLSLARTALALMSAPSGDVRAHIEPVRHEDFVDEIEHTSWGPARRLHAPFTVAGVSVHAESGALELGATPMPVAWRWA